jgi:hypothetical protein
MKRRLLLMLVCLGLAVHLSPAVTLGENEQPEGEVPTFSNKDLDKYKTPYDNAPQNNMPVDRGAEKIEKTALRDQREREYWCKRAAPYNRKIAKAQAEVKEAQDELAADKDSGRHAVSKSRTLNKRLEKAEKRLKDAERDLSDLGDEAYRKGIPPGWLRCQSD